MRRPQRGTARRIAGVLLCLLAVVLPCSASLAWLDGGHLQVAAITWERLSEAKRRAAVELLRQHPRFDEHFASAMPEWPDDEREASEARWIFTRAAIWPDIARGLEGEERQTYHHGSWHGIGYPYFLFEAASAALQDEVKEKLKREWKREPGEPARNAVQALHDSVARLGDADLPAAERALALCWLLHVGGDVHQPLHAASLYSDVVFPQGDGGGGRIPVEGRENLHVVWDAAPGTEVELDEVAGRVDELLKDRGRRSAGKQAAELSDFDSWVSESFRLAKQTVYDDSVLAPVLALEQGGDGPLVLTLSGEYLEQAAKLSRRRVVEAGYRLARAIEQMKGL